MTNPTSMSSSYSSSVSSSMGHDSVPSKMFLSTPVLQKIDCAYEKWLLLDSNFRAESDAKKREKFEKGMARQEAVLKKYNIVIQMNSFVFPEQDLPLLKSLYPKHLLDQYVDCSLFVFYHLNLSFKKISSSVCEPMSWKPGNLIYYDEKHVGFLLCQKKSTWYVLSKWGSGPVISHPIHNIGFSYFLCGRIFNGQLRYGIPLFRLIAERVEEVLKMERTTGSFHHMLPSPLSPLGVAKHWERWIQETDKTMPLFSQAMMGERTRKICAKEFFKKWSPVYLTLTKNSWAYSRIEVSERVQKVVAALDPTLYQELFRSFWAEKLTKEI